MDSPNYSYPKGLLLRVARDVLLLRPRDFHQDAKACVDHLRPPLQVSGKDNIPRHGPCVVTVNHYHRPGFGAQWLTLAIAAVIPAQMHWIMTAEWMNRGKLRAIGSRILLRRIAYVYGFTTMPPMPPRPRDVEARAAAVRAVLGYVQCTPAPVLGLAPEGYDPPDGILTRPPAGVGRFALLLARAGLQFIPVGAYEAEGRFHLRFGGGYELCVRDQFSNDEKDEQAARLIMEKIACLLPFQLRGEFA